MKNKIGTFTGIPCYKMSFEDYVALEPKFKSEIYIIDGEMVLDNKVIGYYNGKVVREYYEPYEVYIKDKKKEDVMSKVESKPYFAPIEVDVKPQYPPVEFLDADKLLEQVYNLKLEV